MPEIINLRRAAKAKARAEKGKTADANRILHGTAKAQRKLAKAQQARAVKAHIGNKLDN